MIKKSVFITILFMFPVIFSANETLNDNFTINGNILNNQSTNSSSIFSSLDFVSNYSLIVLLIGLTAFYIIGKIAFKLTKWLILIIAIILLLKLFF